tara:strand:- start:478 stop:795 length:318 start_codon:yes stop_codon:yes gene_type:complete
MATKKELATAYILARDRILRDTGKNTFKHVVILNAIFEQTGVKHGKDVYGYLLDYGRAQSLEVANRTIKAYALDRQLQVAQARASVQPVLISMNSNIRFWGDPNE